MKKQFLDSGKIVGTHGIKGEVRIEPWCDSPEFLIEAAERLRGRIIYIDRADVKLDEGVHFVQDLIGLEVRDFDTGEVYGILTDVLRTGANDVYEITRDGKKYLAPVIDEVVREINTDGGYVLLTPMKGIFDDEN